MLKNLPQSLVGRRISLVRCNDQYTHLPEGLLGTIHAIHNLSNEHCTVDVDWDNGSTLSLCLDDGDAFELISPQ